MKNIIDIEELNTIFVVLKISDYYSSWQKNAQTDFAKKGHKFEDHLRILLLDTRSFFQLWCQDNISKNQILSLEPYCSHEKSLFVLKKAFTDTNRVI